MKGGGGGEGRTGVSISKARMSTASRLFFVTVHMFASAPAACHRKPHATARRWLARSAMPAGGCGTVACMRAQACPCVRACVSVACAPVLVCVRVRVAEICLRTRIVTKLGAVTDERQDRLDHARPTELFGIARGGQHAIQDCTRRIQHTTLPRGRHTTGVHASHTTYNPATWQAYNRRSAVIVRPAEQDKRYGFPK